jgi:hypothetical protein
MQPRAIDSPVCGAELPPLRTDPTDTVGARRRHWQGPAARPREPRALEYALVRGPVRSCRRSCACVVPSAARLGGGCKAYRQPRADRTLRCFRNDGTNEASAPTRKRRRSLPSCTREEPCAALWRQPARACACGHAAARRCRSIQRHKRTCDHCGRVAECPIGARLPSPVLWGPPLARRPCTGACACHSSTEGLACAKHDAHNVSPSGSRRLQQSGRIAH